MCDTKAAGMSSVGFRSWLLPSNVPRPMTTLSPLVREPLAI